jgi:hypothetical protein
MHVCCTICKAYVRWSPPYVRTKDRGVRPADLAYVRLLRVSVWLIFSKGSKRDQFNARVFGSHESTIVKNLC